MNINVQEMRRNAQTIVSKGILVIDENNAICNRRCEKLSIPTTEERRCTYRD